jgi:hypothetical protein
MPTAMPAVAAKGGSGGRRQRGRCKRGCGNCNKREFAKHGYLLGFGAIGAISDARQRPLNQRGVGRWSKRTPEKLNESGMFVSERVHLREIAVIPGTDCPPGASRAFRLIACRSPMAPI